MSWWEEGALDRERWRPVVGPFLDRLLAARDRDRFPQSLLLVGPPGLGRELTALETAVLLTCPEAERPWCEGGCCDRVRRGSHPDVVAVLPQGAANQIKIDQVREVVDSSPGRPFEGLRRVWIFDGVEAGRFGAKAANAFLKTLEEPPEHAVFLLLAANPTAVLPTIRSRCQQLVLPGPVALAHHLGEETLPELAATGLAGIELDSPIAEVRDALRAALGGELHGLLRLSHVLPGGVPHFELVASVAVREALADDDPDTAGELVRLAADLLAAERRARSLNLLAGRQLLACMLNWYRELGCE